MVENKSIFVRIMPPLLVILVYLFLYLPVFVLTLFSFNDSSTSVTWVGFSFRWYYELINNPEVLKALKTSLIVAISSSIMSLILGTSLVVASRWWRGNFPFGIFYVNILLPELVLSIGLLSIFTFLQIPVGYGSLITGHTILGLGFVVPIVRSRFAELDPVLTEASLDLGATHMQTFKYVWIPLLKPSLIASTLLVFTLSLDDFLIAFFCSGPSVQTLSAYVYSMARSGIDPTINAISVCFLLVSSLIVFLFCYFDVAERVLTHE